MDRRKGEETERERYIYIYIERDWIIMSRCKREAKR